jgi:CRP-like cAMP-binding protein
LTADGAISRPVNRVLASLTVADASLVLPQLELVHLNREATLFVEGEQVTHVYFPISGLVSLVTWVERHAVESATVGSEGMAGLSAFLESMESACDYIVQMEGDAWRL